MTVAGSLSCRSYTASSLRSEFSRAWCNRGLVWLGLYTYIPNCLTICRFGQRTTLIVFRYCATLNGGIQWIYLNISPVLSWLVMNNTRPSPVVDVLRIALYLIFFVGFYITLVCPLVFFHSIDNVMPSLWYSK